MCAVEKEQVVERLVQVADAASQTDGINVRKHSISTLSDATSWTDEDVTDREQLFHINLREMIYQFFAHTIDINRGNLISKLATKDIFSPRERQTIREGRMASDKVNSLLMMLREKSPAQFESFLTTLCEAGQQSVADVVRQALLTGGQTGQNPLKSICGKTVYFIIIVIVIVFFYYNL